jgi:hypothetical protein
MRFDDIVHYHVELDRILHSDFYQPNCPCETDVFAGNRRFVEMIGAVMACDVGRGASWKIKWGLLLGYVKVGLEQ